MTRTYEPDDIIYMRFYQDGKVLRVARADTARGIVSALYPSKDPNIFHREAFTEIDQESDRPQVSKSKIRDKIWLKLLEGEGIEGILDDYEPVAQGTSSADNKVSYFFAERGSEFNRFQTRTFHICDDKNEEGILEERAAQIVS